MKQTTVDSCTYAFLHTGAAAADDVKVEIPHLLPTQRLGVDTQVKATVAESSRDLDCEVLARLEDHGPTSSEQERHEVSLIFPVSWFPLRVNTT